MNGAGTQESPYIIMNADDLYSMETVGGSNVYFSMGTDIDLNNTQYGEKFVPIPLKCKKLIGNGCVIRNVNYSSPNENVSLFSIINEGENSDITIDSLRIENIKLSGKNAFIFGNGGNTKYNLSLEHCVFIMNDIAFSVSEPYSANDRRCLMHDVNIAISADYCTFVAGIYFQGIQSIFYGDTISNSQMKFEINTQYLSASDDKYNAPMSSVTVSDSYFFVTINRRVGSSAEMMNFSSSDSTFSRCYMVCEVIAGISVVLWNGTIGGICFYDDQIISRRVNYASLRNNNSNYSSKIRGLTTEQCKDAVYLRSIGFNCMGADE